MLRLPSSYVPTIHDRSIQDHVHNIHHSVHNHVHIYIHIHGDQQMLRLWVQRTLQLWVRLPFSYVPTIHDRSIQGHIHDHSIHHSHHIHVHSIHHAHNHNHVRITDRDQQMLRLLVPLQQLPRGLLPSSYVHGILHDVLHNLHGILHDIHHVHAHVRGSQVRCMPHQIRQVVPKA